MLVFVHISEKPEDADHDYGHGKYETMASAIIGMVLLVVGAALCFDGLARIASVAAGGSLAQPGAMEPFRTELWTTGRVAGDTLRGDLYVVGGFDPEFDTDDLEELIGGLTRRGIRVVPLVGPSSIILAMMASGLNGQSFAFNGYLPVKPPERLRAIRFFERRARSEGQSQLFIEAPYRNGKLLEQLVRTLAPETRLTVAADLTAPAERIETRTVGEWRRMALPELNKRPAIFIIG